MGHPCPVFVVGAVDIYVSAAAAATAVVVDHRSCMNCLLLLVWASCIRRLHDFLHRMNLVDREQ